MTSKIHTPDEAFYFEPVTKYLTAGLPMPVRKTEMSAGYDMVVAEDIILYPYESYMDLLKSRFNPEGPVTLAEMAAMTKEVKAKPALVSTGMKCKLEPGTYLELSVRSSSPLKYWIMMANSVGIIDGDYYNNPDNEGEIFFQLYNMTPFPIKIQKGEAIGQGIIKNFGISPGQITRLKRNESVSTHTIEVFCEILDCEVQDIMKYIPEKD